MANSQFLNNLTQNEREELIKELHEIQHGRCFITGKEIDLDIHINEIDIDHVIPLANNGKDNKTNLALTFSSANRSKQAADLNLARICWKFKDIAERKGGSPNLSDILTLYGGETEELNFKIEGHTIKFSFSELGRHEIITTPIYTDPIGDEDYFFAKIPIQYIRHDEDINPRPINSNIYKLLAEFYKGNPQLHISLGYIENIEKGKSPIKIFDGQHKAAAQIMLGATEIPVRVFVNPHKDKIRKTNYRAGTTLKQVAFDLSTQRQFGNRLYADTIRRYQIATGRNEDDFAFSEKSLVTFFKSEAREIKKYIIDAIKIGGIKNNPDNRLWQFVCDDGESTRYPLTFRVIDRTFFSLFIGKDLLETNINFRNEEGMNPRDIEIKQIVRLMNIIADTILIDKFISETGTYQIESRVKKGEIINLDHLRACRMMKYDVLYVWLELIKESIKLFFSLTSSRIIRENDPIFQTVIPDVLWQRLEIFIQNLSNLPLWKNTELHVFSGYENTDGWRHIFSTGRARNGEIILAEPLNINELITQKE